MLHLVYKKTLCNSYVIQLSIIKQHIKNVNSGLTSGFTSSPLQLLPFHFSTVVFFSKTVACENTTTTTTYYTTWTTPYYATTTNGGGGGASTCVFAMTVIGACVLQFLQI